MYSLCTYFVRKELVLLFFIFDTFTIDGKGPVYLQLRTMINPEFHTCFTIPDYSADSIDNSSQLTQI